MLGVIWLLVEWVTVGVETFKLVSRTALMSD